jgi:hypothetical protein
MTNFDIEIDKIKSIKLKDRARNAYKNNLIARISNWNFVRFLCGPKKFAQACTVFA